MILRATHGHVFSLILTFRYLGRMIASLCLTTCKALFFTLLPTLWNKYEDKQNILMAFACSFTFISLFLQKVNL